MGKLANMCVGQRLKAKKIFGKECQSGSSGFRAVNRVLSQKDNHTSKISTGRHVVPKDFSGLPKQQEVAKVV